MRDNIATLRNIILFSNKRYNDSFYLTAYWYGPGDPKNPDNAPKNRKAYAEDVINRYKVFKPYFECLTR